MLTRISIKYKKSSYEAMIQQITPILFLDSILIKFIAEKALSTIVVATDKAKASTTM